MKYPCREVDLIFLETAPVRFVNVVEVNATPEQIFSSWQEAQSWPQWYDGILDVEWTSEAPFGVGTTRTVKLATATVYEKFILWEQNKRFSFYFTGVNKKLFAALAEDYELEVLANGKTRFTYTVAYEPDGLLRWAGPIGRFVMRSTFAKATQSMAVYMDKTFA